MNQILAIENLYKKVDTENSDVSYVDYWTPFAPNIVKDYIENYGLKTKTRTGARCASGCENCQISHIEKYKKDYPTHPIESKRKVKADPKAFASHAFQISCPLIPKDYLEQYSEFSNELSPEEKDALVIKSR